MSTQSAPPEQAKSTKWIAVYTRKSNDENLTGEVTSIDNQKNACRSYISIYKDKGWQEYAETFDDPAESGKDLKRPAVQRLLKAVEEGRVQGVIVYKLDRLTRNSRDFHHLMEIFEKRGVAFVSATEALDTKSPQGRLMVNIMVQFAQYDRELDQERSKDFHLARARKGLWCAGLPPIGYDIKEKLLVVNADEADVVRRIFEMYLKFQSAVRVAGELNRLGFRRKTHKTGKGKLVGGKPFDKDTIIRILQRKVYIGLIVNERTGQEFPGQHQAIIEPKIFEQVQKLLESHNKRDDGQVLYARNKYGFLLRGLVRCGDCGSAVVSYIRDKKKKTYLYYKCLAEQNGMPVDCPFRHVAAPKLEEYVIEKLATIAWDRSFLERVVEDARKRAGAAEGERRALEDKLKGVREEIQNLVNAARGGSSGEISAEIARIEEAKRELEAQTVALREQAGRQKEAVYDVDVLERALQNFARLIYRIPVALRTKVMALLVKQVTVHKGRIDMELHELPANVLQEALVGRAGGDGFGGDSGEKFKYRLSRTAGPLTPQEPEQIQPGGGTAVAELKQSWRGRRGHKTTGPNLAPVPVPEKVYILPAFSITWPIAWGRITNGELVVTESISSCGQKTTDFDVPEFKPHYPSWMV